jgi:hypothetical protein
MRDYAQGNHPLWQFVRSIYQMRRKPAVVRGVVLGTGYVWAGLRRIKRPVSREFIKFRQSEQMQRLVRMIKGKASSPRSSETLPHV